MTTTIHPDDNLEYTRQMLLWGDVELDASGRVVRREEPEYWQAMRKTWFSGRGYGKTSLQRHLERMHEEVQRIIDKTDELHRIAAGWVCAPKAHPAIPEIEEFRWVCWPPTQAPVPGSMRWYQEQAVQFLAGGAR